jgi:hypothetical protein
VVQYARAFSHILPPCRTGYHARDLR